MMRTDSPYLPEDDGIPEQTPTPWSFKVFVVLAAIYLLYRLGQGVVWVVDRFS
jgi:hypothetical protein